MSKFLIKFVFIYESKEANEDVRIYTPSLDSLNICLIQNKEDIIDQVALECSLVKKFFQDLEVKEEKLIKEILEYILLIRSKFFDDEYEVLGKNFLLSSKVLGEKLKLVFDLDNERTLSAVQKIIENYKKKEMENAAEKK